MLIMYEEDESEIEWQNINDIKKKRLYITSELSSSDINSYLYGVQKFAKHNKQGKNISYLAEGNFIKQYHSQIKANKVRINNLGKIEKLGEEQSQDK